MKYLKNFENYKVQETIDLMSLPTDVVSNLGRSTIKNIDILISFLQREISKNLDNLRIYLDSNFHNLKDFLFNKIKFENLPTVYVLESKKNFENYFGFKMENANYENIYKKLTEKGELKELNNIMKESWFQNNPWFRDKYAPNDEGTIHSILNVLTSIFGANLLSFGFFLKLFFDVFLVSLVTITFTTSIIISIVALIVCAIVKSILYHFKLY